MEQLRTLTGTVEQLHTLNRFVDLCRGYTLI